MTFSYDVVEPATRDKLRLQIGDTNPPPRNAFEDEELDSVLSLESDDLDLATARCFRILAGSHAKLEVVIQAPGITYTRNQVAQRFLEMADKIEATAKQRATPEVANVYDATSEWYDSVTGRYDIDFDLPSSEG